MINDCFLFPPSLFLHRVSKAVKNADYIVIAGVGLIVVLAILFCCKEFYMCILNCFRERRVRNQREHVKLIERRSLDLSSSLSTITIQSDQRRYSRVADCNLDIVEEDEEPPNSPGEGWKMTRCNSEEIVYMYPSESHFEEVSIEEDAVSRSRQQNKPRRVTWHNLGEGVGDRMSAGPSWRNFIQEIKEENTSQESEF